MAEAKKTVVGWHAILAFWILGHHRAKEKNSNQTSTKGVTVRQGRSHCNQGGTICI